MKVASPPPFVDEQFIVAFRRHVHLLLAWGIASAKAKIQPGSQEDAITGFIAEAIQLDLIRQQYSWMRNYSVHNEHPIPNDVHPGKQRRCIDLIVEFGGIGRPAFVFEAKPLNYTKRHQREPNYTDGNAMGRFLSGDYAEYTARFAEVGMLGYVLSDSVATWRDRLKQAIDANKVTLSLRRSQADVSVVAEFPLEWISEHDRKSASQPITIYHVLAPCI